MTTTKIFVSNPNLNFTEILLESEFHGLIPTNYLVNKKRPGLGATYAELKSLRHSIIIEPYIAVIEVKKVKFERELCVIMGDISKKQVDATISQYLGDISVRYKKFMTTPESFHKLITVLRKFDGNYKRNYFLLIDECEKWIKQAIFRSKMLKPLEEFFEFNQKAMISATPIIPSHSIFTEQNFKLLEIEPLFVYKKDIKVITTNNIRTSSRNCLSLITDNLPVFIFTNCRDTIYYLTQLESVKEDFKVFCAEDLDIRFFQNQSLPNVCYSNKEQQYAKYNFLTSRFFSAVDIDLTTKAHVLMITNVQQTAHSIIDPQIEGVQIYGRCRKGVQSITHISNIYPDRDVTSKEIIVGDTEEEVRLVCRLRDLQSKSYNKPGKAAADSFIDKMFASEVFNEDGTINDFKKDNLIDSRIVKSFYYSEESLLKEYEDSKFFNPTWVPVTHIFSDLDKIKISKAKNRKRRTEVASQLHKLVCENKLNPLNLEEYNHELDRLKKADEFMFNAYFDLGFDELRNLQFSKTKITEAIFNLKKIEGDNCMLMIDKIIATFPLNVKLYSDDIKEQLQHIYSEFEYQKKPGVLYKAKGTDIEDYFDCKLHNGKQKIDGAYKSWYKLFASKDKISKDLQYLTNR